MKKYYERELAQFKEYGCKLPEAAALQNCVEKAVREKSYKVYDYGIENPEEVYAEFDIIVVFDRDGHDVLFGVFRLEDGENAIEFSTSDGLKRIYL